MRIACSSGIKGRIYESQGLKQAVVAMADTHANPWGGGVDEGSSPWDGQAPLLARLTRINS